MRFAHFSIARLSFALFLCAGPLLADGILSFNLSPAEYQVHPGDTLLLGGTLENTGDADLFLNDFLVQFASPGDMYLAADPNYFFDNVPGLFMPGDQYAGNIFEVSVADAAPLGTFDGTGTIYGGIDAFANVPLGIQTFVVDVVPEPGTIFLIAIGLTALGARSARHRKVSALDAESRRV